MTTSQNKILIAGLGNPGKQYARTRHNVGFMIIDALIDELRNRNYEVRSMKIKSCAAEIFKINKLSPLTKGGLRGVDPLTKGGLLVKPQTYMNNSGESVSRIANFYKIPPQNIWVIYDDIALPLGTLRIREKGSAGGHNGLQSIINHLNTNGFPRFRVGIGPVPSHKTTEEYVLESFTKIEFKTVQNIINATKESIHFALTSGIPKTMSSFN